ncbi:MAG: hypothetical protein MIO92_09095, partial [Methanosarcinaceae archaeon]|nr:hypothetical protein [Methanosarcinaceae archaeon]
YAIYLQECADSKVITVSMRYDLRFSMIEEKDQANNAYINIRIEFLSTTLYQLIFTDTHALIFCNPFFFKKAPFQFKNQFPAQKNETKSYKPHSIWSSIDSSIL